MGQIQANEKFGNYTLENRLGVGGYAEVWLGKHDYMDTEAAIKILHLELPTQVDRDHFLGEARHLAGFNHPNIVRVMECGIQNNIPFLVLEFAPLGNLRTRHPKGTRLSPDLIVKYVRQIADGLRYAHNRRLVHRDVKPENILISKNNELLVSDFGIAAIEETISFTSFLQRQGQQQQEVLGTLGYMSPEQYDGYPIPASDQYSLAVVVYEWLCGSLPFKGTAIDIRTQQKMKPPQLRDKVPGISPALEQVVLKALSEAFPDRYPDIVAFADALEQAVNNPHMPWPPNPTPAGRANPGAPPLAGNNANANNNKMGGPPPDAIPFGPNNPNPGPPPLWGNTNANIPNPGAPPLWGNAANPNNNLGGFPPFGASPFGPNNPNAGGAPHAPDPFGAPTAQTAPNPGGNHAQAGAPPFGNGHTADPFGQIPNGPFHRPDPNAETVQADLPHGTSPFYSPSGPNVPQAAPTQTNRARKPTKLFDWRRIWREENRLFVFGGGIVDFLLAVALGVYLNDGYASWNLWLASIIVAWTTRILCAGMGRKYLAIPLAVALAFYWFLGSWAFATSFNVVTHLNLVPPYIIAILFGAASAVMHIHFANKKK